MATATGPIGTYSVGSVLTRITSMIGRSWPLLVVFGLGYAVCTAAASAIATSSMVATTTENVQKGVASPLSAITSVGFLSGLILPFFLAGFASCAMLSDLLAASEKRNDFGAAFQTAVSRFLPYTIMSLLLTLAVVFGFALFVVPGLILMTIWAATAPAMIKENRGLFSAFGRSLSLTRGYRWPVFGSLLILGLIYFGYLGILMSFGNSAGVTTMDLGGHVGQALGVSVIQAVTISFLAAIYEELVAAKEGGDSSALAEIFR
jgi:hypothetical protein